MASSTSVLDLNKKWFLVPLPLRTCSLKDIATTNVTKEQMDAYFQEAQAILDAETSHSQLDRGRWYNAQFLTRGTTSDKIAAAAVKLADTDFMFFLDGFNLLFDTARTDTHHYEAALKALAAVWPKLLPPRPLKRFVSQYFATLPTEETARKKVLVYWYLEDHLKRTYAQFLSLSEAMLKDRLVQRREAWLEVVGKLMCAVAEGRNVAMAMMIDKLGDPNAQVAHKAYHHLLKLLSESSTHQNMLFTELEKVIFMKNCPLRTMRYAANVMNQLVFSKDERKLALKSVQTYLSLFRQLVMTGTVDSTVTTAIIVGLRRSFPYAGTDVAALQEHLDALFVFANTGTFQQRVATLSLLQLLALGKGVQEAFQDRWYRALYQLLLLSPKQMPQSTQMTNFFSMLHKAMRADKKEPRIAAFVHRLLQRAVFFTDAMICAVLLLVGEMVQSHSSIRQLIRPGPGGRHSSSKAPSQKTKEGDAGNDDSSARYDPKLREPQYAHASSECLWTLNLLARHSHPSVVKLAVLLLFGEDIVFDVHPLDDMTLMNFLQMFVDAKGKSATAGETASTTTGGSSGVSVFRRAPHLANVPSASDPYFIQASAQDVDVSALFLHRYAVQRERFLEGLNQAQSTWGEQSGELDVAVKVSKLDTALFGPTGLLGEPAPDTEGKAARNAAATAASKAEKKASGAAKDKTKKEVGKEAAASAEDEEGSVSGGSSAFDAEASEDDLEWGSDDDAAYDEAMDDLDDEDLDDDLGEDDEALGGRQRRAAGGASLEDGEEFGDLMESHRQGPSKKRLREEDWLERRAGEGKPSAAAAAAGRRAAYRKRGRY